jgi:hypothetical protein
MVLDIQKYLSVFICVYLWFYSFNQLLIKIQQLPC